MESQERKERRPQADTVNMEVLYTAAAIAALAVPGWLFKRVPTRIGTLLTLFAWFFAAFFGSLADEPRTIPRAIAWGAGFGAIGGLGFYLAKRFEVWEARHPVDIGALTRQQIRVRRLAIPLAGLSLLAIPGGVIALALQAISFATWAVVVMSLLVVCGILYFLFLKLGKSQKL